MSARQIVPLVSSGEIDMSAAKQYGKPVNVEARVRRNVGSAGLAAGLLIFFGFFQLVKPTEGGVGGYAALVFYHTLRFGGPAMAAVAVWSSLGHPLALFFDAVVSCLIGAILILSGVLMAIGGGSLLPTLLMVVCGALFVSAGLRNSRDFLQFPIVAKEKRDEQADRRATAFGDSPANRQPTAERLADETSSSLPGELLKRSAKSADFDPRSAPHTTGGARFAAQDDAIRLPDSDASASRDDVKPSSPPEGQKTAKPLCGDEKRKPKAPPPTEGYLADLADDDPSDRP